MYRLAAELADDLYRVVVGWPAFERWTVGVQCGSAYELEHWLLRARARALLDDSASARLGDIARALNGLIRRQAPS